MLRSLIKTLRPKQWAKNIFLLAALVFDRQLTNVQAVASTLIGVVIFSILASSIYIINDIQDLEADKTHPKKRTRPIASGAISIRSAWIIALILMAIGIPGAYFLSPTFFAIALTYVMLNFLYSKWLKHVPLLDILVLASFYVLRVSAGVVLIHVERFSPWLYVSTIFLALIIGTGKRRAEIGLLANEANSHRRVLDGYSLSFLDQLITVVSSIAILTYSQYTFSAPNLPANHSMMLTIPFVIYGIFRYLYLIQVQHEGGAPEEIMLADRPIQVNILLWGISIFFIFYLS